MGQTPSTFPLLTPSPPPPLPIYHCSFFPHFLIALPPIVVLIALHPPRQTDTQAKNSLHDMFAVADISGVSSIGCIQVARVANPRLEASSRGVVSRAPVQFLLLLRAAWVFKLAVFIPGMFFFADPGPPEMYRQWPGDAPEVSRCASWCFVDPPTRPGTTCRMFISTPCAVDLLISQLVSSRSRSWLNGRRPPSRCIAEVPVAAATAARRLGSFRSWRRSGVAHSLGGPAVSAPLPPMPSQPSQPLAFGTACAGLGETCPRKLLVVASLGDRVFQSWPRGDLPCSTIG